VAPLARQLKRSKSLSQFGELLISDPADTNS